MKQSGTVFVHYKHSSYRNTQLVQAVSGNNKPQVSIVAMAAFLALGPVLLWTKDLRQYASGSADKYSESLIVAPGARSPQFRKYPDGRQQLSYTVDVAYPANDVVRHISTRLNKEGWKLLRHNFLNPEIPSSVVRGWQETEDTTQNPAVVVRGWGTDWENGAHDVIEYNLEYRFRYPKTGPLEIKNLRVIALYIPAAVVNKMKSEIGSRGKHSKN